MFCRRSALFEFIATRDQALFPEEQTLPRSSLWFSRTTKKGPP